MKCTFFCRRYLNEVDQLISYLADIHQPQQVLPDIVLVHGLDVYASRSAAVIFPCLCFFLDSGNLVTETHDAVTYHV